MELSIHGDVLKIQGQIEDAVLVQILTDSAKERPIEDAFLEILLLGAKVKEVIQTTATTQSSQPFSTRKSGRPLNTVA